MNTIKKMKMQATNWKAFAIYVSNKEIVPRTQNFTETGIGMASKSHEKTINIISHHGNTNRAHNGKPLRIYQTGWIQNTDDTKFGQECRASVQWYNPLGKQTANSNKVKYTFATWLNNAIHRSLSQRRLVHTRIEHESL